MQRKTHKKIKTNCKFSRVWDLLRVFPQLPFLAPVPCFPSSALVTCHFAAFSTRFISSRVWHRLHVSPCLAPNAGFPTLDTSSKFSRAWHQLQVFPRLTPVAVACFLALDTRCMFSRAWRQLHVFPRLTPDACFPVLDTKCMFSRAWQQLHVFPF